MHWRIHTYKSQDLVLFSRASAKETLCKTMRTDLGVYAQKTFKTSLTGSLLSTKRLRCTEDVDWTAVKKEIVKILDDDTYKER